MVQLSYTSSFAEACSKLPKEVRAKLSNVLHMFYKAPTSKGLHLEKINGDNLYSARIDDNYRIIYSIIDEDKDFVSLLYADKHDDAYQWANSHRIVFNDTIGSASVVQMTTLKPQADGNTKRLVSRLSKLSDKQMFELQIPSEHWTQLRTQVIRRNQLFAFRDYMSEPAFETLCFIIDGEDIDAAMSLYQDQITEIIPEKVEHKKPYFDSYTDDDLLSVGISRELLPRVRLIKTDKELELVCSDMPLLAAQSLYALHNGEDIESIKKNTFSATKPNVDGDIEDYMKNVITLSDIAPFDNEESIKAFLENPAAKWRAFLHPSQRQIIERDYNGAARVIGGAGTGKTVVVVHRARYLARKLSDDQKLLITTFGKTLSLDIEQRLKQICSTEELKKINIQTIDQLTYNLTKEKMSRRLLYGDHSKKNGITQYDFWNAALNKTGLQNVFTPEFCIDEWRDVIQAQNLQTESSYLETLRSGRGKQLDANMRKNFWKVASTYQTICNSKYYIDPDWAQNTLASILDNETDCSPYDYILIDECQDLRTPAFRMLRVLAGKPHENDLYIAGDSRQRIYKGKTSLSQCGISINNRSKTLKLNYRTTAEIYQFAMQFQKQYEYDDLDGSSINGEENNCIFHGPKPVVRGFESEASEVDAIIKNIKQRIAYGVDECNICILVRSNQLVRHYASKLRDNGFKTLMVTNEQPDNDEIPGIRVMTMHRAKGMEYDCVYIASLNEDIVPPKKDIIRATSENNLQDLYISEANLLSVAITRAKHFCWLSYYGNKSSMLNNVM